MEPEESPLEGAVRWLRAGDHSIQQVAAVSGLSEETIRKIKNGKNSRPSASTLQRLSKAKLELTPNTEGRPSQFLFEAVDGPSSELHEPNGGAKPDDHQSKESTPPPSDTPEKSQKAHEPSQEIFFAVHGFVWLTRTEEKLINHPAFQRLRRVKQLGIASSVYPGATHTRFEHVLGVLHITSRIVDAIETNHRRAEPIISPDSRDSAPWGQVLTEVEKIFVRLASLFHDVGHLPFGHSIEDELGLLDKHDEERRLTHILDKSYDKQDSVGFPSLREEIEASYSSRLRLDSISTDLSACELLISIILHHPTDSISSKYEELIKGLNNSSLVTKEMIFDAFCKDLAKGGVRLRVCADIVGNTICADLLDYLHRDWHHVGKTRYLDDRALHYMEIRSLDPSAPGISTAPNHTDRFVINLGSYPRLRTDAVSLILELLESRYSLAEAVLFHRTKLKLTAMLERCLVLAFDLKESNDFAPLLVEGLLSLSDDSVLEELALNEARALPIKSRSAQITRKRIRLASAIRDRFVYKHVHTISYTEARPEAVMRFQAKHTKAGREGAQAREEALLQAEADFGLETGDLVMYCPSPKMNNKIAEVKVLIGGELHQLDDFDRVSTDKLAAGHLAAQIERFRKLWKVTFLVDPEVQTRRSLTDAEFRVWRQLLADYIQAFVVGTWQGKEISRARADVAAAMAASEVFSKVWAFEVSRTLEVDPQSFQAAARATGADPRDKRAKAGGATGRFPSGAQSFWYYVSKGYE